MKHHFRVGGRPREGKKKLYCKDRSRTDIDKLSALSNTNTERTMEKKTPPGRAGGSEKASESHTNSL